ncbi:uncharacterized protein LOC124157564 [Ischnura elegans]|uniref:uncharacterized protein LOC124157564 n=1 Tax=Ischnura elegans TaxID=197161 RepID=UPI001ED8B71F|nr:uncharacterized protein LOC124157564 [Ischnura elegans]
MKRRVSQGTSRRENNPAMNPVDDETPGPSGLSASKKKQPRKTLREDEIRALAMDSSDDNFSSGSSFIIDSDGSDTGESDSDLARPRWQGAPKWLGVSLQLRLFGPLIPQ